MRGDICGWWHPTVKHSVHQADLVVLITDPSNWRFGEISKPIKIELHPEGIALKLHFSDGHEHTEDISSYRDKIPVPVVYYRHSNPLSEGGRIMSQNGQGIYTLERRYGSLRAHSDWLHRDFLDMQYRLLFGEPFPFRTNPSMSGNNGNGHI